MNSHTSSAISHLLKGMSTYWFSSKMWLCHSTLWMHRMDANKTYRENLNGKYTRLQRAVLIKFWKQYPIKQQPVRQLTSHHKKDPRRTRNAGHCWRKKKRTHKWLSSLDPYTRTCQCWLTSKNFVQTLDVVWRTYQEWWMIWTDGKRDSEKSVSSLIWRPSRVSMGRDKDFWYRVGQESVSEVKSTRIKSIGMVS